MGARRRRDVGLALQDDDRRVVRLAVGKHAPVRPRRPVALKRRRPTPDRLVDVPVVLRAPPDVGGVRLLAHEAAAPAAEARMLQAPQTHVDLVHERRRISLGAEGALVRLIGAGQRAAIHGDVPLHPRPLEEDAVRQRDEAPPVVGDGAELTDAGEDLQLGPVGLDVLAEGHVLVQDDVDDGLLADPLDLVGVLSLNRRERLGDGVRPAPGLEIDLARLVVEEDGDDPIGPGRVLLHLPDVADVADVDPALELLRRREAVRHASSGWGRHGRTCRSAR